MTPEAPETSAVFEGGDVYEITLADLADARAALTTTRDGPLDMVALGTPHFSLTEFETLVTLLEAAKGGTCPTSSRPAGSSATCRWERDGSPISNAAGQRSSSTPAPIIRPSFAACEAAS